MHVRSIVIINILKIKVVFNSLYLTNRYHGYRHVVLYISMNTFKLYFNTSVHVCSTMGTGMFSGISLFINAHCNSK